MISVRRLRTGEWELYRQVRLAALRESPSAFGTRYESAASRTPESWAEQADSTAEGPDRCTYIAFHEERPIGLAALYRIEHGHDVGELLQVWVSPEFRGHGAADSIMDAVYAWASKNGFGRIVARVARLNGRALRFYRRRGFDPTNRVTSDVPDDTIVLAKRVQGRPVEPSSDTAGD